MNAKRPLLLTHWSGKDIDNAYAAGGLLGSLGRSRYVERLQSILLNGLWMTTPTERLVGRSGVYIRYERPMTCFTELRASSAAEHSQTYGHLGISVDRNFVLTRQGGPVRYVWSTNDALTVGRLYATRYGLKQLLVAARKRKDERDVKRISKLLDQSAWTIAFTKNMDMDGNGSFTELDEQEWRGVADDDIRGLQRSPRGKTPHFTIPLAPEDVRVLLVPDADTRDAIINDRKVRRWFGKALPPILTANDVRQL